MAWTGIGVGLGLLLLVTGVLTVVAGIGVAAIGPSVVDDSHESKDESLLFNDHDAGEQTREQRQGVRAIGGVIAAAGAGAALIGGLIYAAARGVEAHRTSRPS